MSEPESHKPAERFNAYANLLIGDKVKWNEALGTEVSHYVPNFRSFHHSISACDGILLNSNKVFERDLNKDYFPDLALIYYDLLAYHRIIKIMQEYATTTESQDAFMRRCHIRLDDFEHFTVDPIAAFYLKQLAPSSADDPCLGICLPHLPSLSNNSLTAANGYQWSLDYVQLLPNIVASYRKAYRAVTGIHGPMNHLTEYGLDYDLTTEATPTAASVPVRPGTGAKISLYAPINPSTCFKAFIPTATQLQGYRQSQILVAPPKRSDVHSYNSEIELFRLNSSTLFIERVKDLMRRRNAYFVGSTTYGSLGLGETSQAKITAEYLPHEDLDDALSTYLNAEIDVPTLTPPLPTSAVTSAGTAGAPDRSTRQAIALHCAAKKIRYNFSYDDLMTSYGEVFPSLDTQAVRLYSREHSTTQLAGTECAVSLWNCQAPDLLPFTNPVSNRTGIFYAERIRHQSGDLTPFRYMRNRILDNFIPRG